MPPLLSVAQKTKVEGIVMDGLFGEPLPFAKVQFQNSKIGVYTDSVGHYMLESYYATDSLVFTFTGYIKSTVFISKDQSQEVNITLNVLQSDVAAVFVRPLDELPSTRLHKRIIANKPINNKEKLASYEYEVHNKVQLDVNNIGAKFKERGLVKRLDLIMEYLDSSDNGTSFLPVILSESVSDFYYKKDPKKKREVVKATRISGVENLQMNQFLGDMYLDVNIYDNYIPLFNKSFISPAANFARNFYKFYLEDSTFIGEQWCYKLRFAPKRTGDMTFEGEMWIHDTTYAVKSFKANISPSTNINYVQGLYIEHEFELVASEVWMLVSEKMIADLKIAKKAKVYGFYGRRHSTRENYVINEVRPPDFYKSNSTVEMLDSADHRTDEFWTTIRHEPLSEQEQGIDNMIDSLNDVSFFKSLKNVIYLATTGYFPLGKVEVGSAFSLTTVNPVEGFRTAFALRTSNNFSKRIEFGGRLAYGFKDKQFKYGLSTRFNITPKKRGMLTAFYNYDIEQIGQSPTAAAVGSTFGTLLRTGPLDKLTFVKRTGINLEKDFGKDVVLFGGFEWKEYKTLENSVVDYLKPNLITGIDDTITRIQTSEFIARYRWAKDEEFLSGSFDRTSIRSKYPVISIQGIFGIKGLLGADYNYQKIDLFIEHNTRIGILGRIRYGLNAGALFGNAAYPFLNIHAGNQSYWLQLNTFNKMNFFEFISDLYVSGLIENHWDGLFLDRIPLIKKLKWRLVTTGRIAFGVISDRHTAEMRLPDFTKQFGNTPYVEIAMGIENIFAVGRVDVFWRLTHLEPNVKIMHISNFGIRARYALNF